MNILAILLILLQAPVGAGNVQGSVLNLSNEPLLAARVELAGVGQDPFVTRTDGQGRFAFANVPQGRYKLSVKKEGYVRQEYGQTRMGGSGTPIVIEPGTPPPGPITFRLQPAATIAGTVRNENAVPIANILVQAMLRSYGVRGNRTITVFSNTLTDDLGNYRLYWVDPGDYYVNASYLPQLPTPVNANEDAPRIAYGPTFYPGFSDAKDARTVRLGGGNVFGGIDFKLQQSPAVGVTGTVTSVLTNAPTQATVTLVAPDESGSTARYSVQTNERGVFAMRSVNPGSYVLSAKNAEGTLLGFSTFNVPILNPPPPGFPAQHADIAIGPGVTINTRLFGDVPDSTNLRSLQVALLPLETYLPAAKPVLMQANGVPALTGVQPGDYLLSVSGLPETGYVKTARSNQRDVLEQFVRAEYNNADPLDILLAFDGGQLTGVAGDASGQPFDGATVVLVPDKARRHRPDQYRVATTTAGGKFSLVGIPPGEYKLFAWESIETNAWVNQEVIANYEEFGAATTIAATARMSAQVRVIAGRP